MSSATAPDWRQTGPASDGFDPRRWLAAGFAALMALIGISILIAVLIPAVRGQAPNWVAGSAPWDWIGGLIGLFLALWIAIWILRLVIWGASGRPYYSPGWRHYYRHYWAGPPYGHDPALEIARERFARGEISQDQFDQIVRQLGKGPGTASSP